MSFAVEQMMDNGFFVMVYHVVLNGTSSAVLGYNMHHLKRNGTVVQNVCQSSFDFRRYIIKYECFNVF